MGNALWLARDLDGDYRLYDHLPVWSKFSGCFIEEEGSAIELTKSNLELEPGEVRLVFITLYD